ncbi:E3 ubiquitin/ISG15 ligase TRIM25-like [Scleropages formosus]|uniref:E3 ubiquitin/ISG15 ligase TRIM25-like n=1 Tax=Scleropages formosus TaxID=113540 RepID=UPI000878F0F6|nr:E3 ubiquitin/ISG15 ligase TRIM25-like [Scleropages formosus]XP_029112227.1 E3 ubiquitin/ISG15 ligase TRIM25-like [Scleropages formosus]
MASVMEESRLEEELTCPACQELLRDPHLLPCGHSLCLACIQEARSQSVGGRFRCPRCREEHGVPVPCDACPDEAPPAVPPAATKTCLRCEVSLCAHHVQPHLERPAFRNHPLVEPLDDLGKRRCPEHEEMFRYYCQDERVYICGDCILEGKHGGHQVKTLKKMEKDLKVVLQGRLQKAEAKLKENEKILKEHNSVDRKLTDSSWADTQVERLGASLGAQVERLMGSLRDSAHQERQQVLARLQEDHSRVMRDLQQTRGIQQYLGALLEEKDPFLLIWAYQSEDKKISSELNTPLFSPQPICLDKKRTLENIENKYRHFISETLRCLEELKKDFFQNQLTLDTNTAHPLLSISDDLHSAARVKERLPYPPHPSRFDHWCQVLTIQSFASGSHYWEVEAEGYWDIAVSYRSIGRKGRDGAAFGNNGKSWSLTQQEDGTLSAWHDKRRTPLSARLTGNRVGVSLDCCTGTIAFCEVGDAPSHLYTFNSNFTQPLHLGFGLYKAGLNSRISIVKM